MIGRREPRQNAIRDFKSEADALESLPPPFPGRTLLYVVMGLVAAAIVWASLSHVDRIVAAKGRLVTTAPRIVIQALETSIIKELYVKAGDRVRRGQAVVALDPTFVTADITALTSQREQLSAQIKRLESEIAGHEYRPEQDNPTTTSQRAIYHHKRAEIAARLRDFDYKRDELIATKDANAQRIVRIREQLVVLTELERIRSAVFQKEVGSRIDLLEAQANRLKLLEELEGLEIQQLEIENRVGSNGAERDLYIHATQRKAFEELVEAKRQLGSLEEALTKATRRGNLVRLTAPVDAIVLELAERSIGSVLREAEVLMTLVPANSELELLADLAPLNVGRVKTGDLARIKIDAFPFQVYGTLEGEVRTISPDSFIENAGTQKAMNYRVRIALKNSDFERHTAAYPLRPGMAATSEIIVGNRSIISFLLYPVIRALDEAGREP